MVFKRNKRPFLAQARDFFYPKGGFRRAIQYLLHRMRRLPDEPHRIARGVFAGCFISFTPLFGFHFFGAALLAWVMRGNILAALLATVIGNPVTFPIIAVTSLELGRWMLGVGEPLGFVTIVAAFTSAGVEIWDNLIAIFTADPTHWESLTSFFRVIFLPYLVGGILPGLAASFTLYYLTLPLIGAYQKIRSHKTHDRIDKRRALKAMIHAANQRAATLAAGAGSAQDDDTTGTAAGGAPDPNDTKTRTRP
ncbi:DUF2062 domain-containing protein [Paracoccaceae bacterium Fryx2]|nr:DUF2062 domain-containing protein [Paracoccaceae bacterium Fryx2]